MGDIKVNGDNWIDLSSVPKQKSRYDWALSNDCIVKFYYEGIYGEFTIIKYNRDTRRFTTKYNNIINDKFTTSSMLGCKLAKILGVIDENYKYNIGDNIKDDNRDITITDKAKIKTVKSYRYKCNKCGYDCGECIEKEKMKKYHWTTEYNLDDGVGCPCCCATPQIVVQGINDMYTTDYWMVELGVDEEFAKTHTKGSNKKAPCKCPECGNIIYKSATSIYKYKSISCHCSDSRVFSEKLLSFILIQLNVDFNPQMIFDWSKNIQHNNYKLCGTKVYDFYIPSLNMIIETHGGQHPNTKFHNKIGFSNINKKRTASYEERNDNLKRELAISNGVDTYVELDCSLSNVGFIKESVLNSQLINLFDFNKVDWLLCEEFVAKNEAKAICQYWESLNNQYTIEHVAKKFNISKDRVRKYLKQGSLLGWCNYETSEEHIKSAVITNKLKRKPIYVFKDNELIYCFEYSGDIDKNSKDILGVKIGKNNLDKYIDKKEIKGFRLSYSAI